MVEEVYIPYISISLITCYHVVGSVCLSAGLWENYWLSLHETWCKVVARAKEEAFTCWIGSELQGRYTFCFVFVNIARSFVTLLSTAK